MHRTVGHVDPVLPRGEDLFDDMGIPVIEDDPEETLLSGMIDEEFLSFLAAHDKIHHRFIDLAEEEELLFVHLLQSRIDDLGDIEWRDEGKSGRARIDLAVFLLVDRDDFIDRSIDIHIPIVLDIQEFGVVLGSHTIELRYVRVRLLVECESDQGIEFLLVLGFSPSHSFEEQHVPLLLVLPDVRYDLRIESVASDVRHRLEYDRLLAVGYGDFRKGCRIDLIRIVDE